MLMLDQSDQESEYEVENETDEEEVEEHQNQERGDSDKSEPAITKKTTTATKKTTATAKKTTAKRPKKKPDMSWQTKTFRPPPHACDVPDEPLKLKENGHGLKTTSSPMEFFELFCNDNFFEQICQETNFYNTQRATDGYLEAIPKNNKRKKLYKKAASVTVRDIKRTIGIILYMGISKLPNRRLYWGNKSAVPMIASSMTRNRFEEIMSILHYNNNNNLVPDGHDGSNKLHKIQPMIDHFRKVFVETVIPETHQAIDEMMVPFKGRHSAKMYMPKKPVKWGYKMWCRAGISGYCYDFEVVGGKDAKGPPSNVELLYEFGESENVVLRLTSGLEKDVHKIFFDNLFTSPEVMIQLRQQGILAVGTLRADRSRGCPMPAESAMRKEGRGAIFERVEKDHNLVICGWYDNRRVLTISNFVGKEPVSEANRYDRKNRKELTLPRPASVEIYNRYMGGVDKADMFLSLYRTKMRTRKWYHRIAFHLISLAVVNAFVVYRQLGGTGALLDFHTDVCRSLLQGEDCIGSDEETVSPAKKVRSLKASTIPMSVRHDNIGHWPMKATVGRCKMQGCTSRTLFICSKCQVYLCVARGGETCFLDFHGVGK